MKLIVCLDTGNGILFGGKRQSRDRVVCEKILALTAGGRLWMNRYSYQLFADLGKNVRIDEAFLLQAGAGDYCFAENADIRPYIDKITQVILFKWNRHYPADTVFPAELFTQKWPLTYTEEFSGYSHDRITMEVYGP